MEKREEGRTNFLPVLESGLFALRVGCIQVIRSLCSNNLCIPISRQRGVSERLDSQEELFFWHLGEIQTK